MNNNIHQNGREDMEEIISLKPRKTYKIVMVRHGESEGNSEKRICGWFDIPLSQKGMEEAKKGGEAINKAGYQFDIAFTGLMRRAIKTLNIIQDVTEHNWIPVIRSWRLNSMHHGDLDSHTREEMVEKHGEENVQYWHSTFDVRPPPMLPDHVYYDIIYNDRRYADVKHSELPKGECLKDTIARMVPLWNEQIAPAMRSGKRVLITGHGSTLRSLAKHMDGIPDPEIWKLFFPNGMPVVFELDEDLKPVKPLELLGDEEEVRIAKERLQWYFDWWAASHVPNGI